jgi:hypothetical protein
MENHQLRFELPGFTNPLKNLARKGNQLAKKMNKQKLLRK